MFYLPGYIQEKCNPLLLQEMFSIKVIEAVEITEDTIHIFKKVDRKHKVSDKVEMEIVRFIKDVDELETLCEQRWQEHLKKNKNTEKVDFVEEEKTIIDKFLNEIDDDIVISAEVLDKGTFNGVPASEVINIAGSSTAELAPKGTFKYSFTSQKREYKGYLNRLKSMEVKENCM